MIETFKPFPVDDSLPDMARLQNHRLNALGSLYYYIKVILKRKRLTDSLHLPICRSLERKHIKDVYEISRDHFKSTICTEGLPTWRTLPVTQKDEDCWTAAGYSPEWIRWMHTIHDPDSRNLLVSENITNAAKLGRKIRWHYESNDIYRACFPETLPDSSCTWTDFSLHTKRPGKYGAHGEGTFDFLGVGSAVQSRHYNGIVVEDDLVGRKAIESQSIMDKTIEYHQLLVGVFEDENAYAENDELVVGNRWSFHDLPSYIREHEPWFVFTNHSALGGCCPAHPADTPIFPEEFSFEKLMRLKQRLGAYNFSCQYLNNPCAPEDADFQERWLNYFVLDRTVDGFLVIKHDVKDGRVRKDMKLGELSMAMAVDPRHSGNDSQGRARHAIVVLGTAAAPKEQKTDLSADYYLLHSEALACGYDTFFNAIYKTAKMWKQKKVGFETVAAQKYAAYHIQQRNKYETWPIQIIELKGEVEAPDGTTSRKKEWRIRNVLAPIFEREKFWVQPKQQDFIAEYTTFPRGRFVDQLDALAYCPQFLRAPMRMEDHLRLLAQNHRNSKLVGQRYTAVN
jgi:hypothetical protein